MPIKEHSIGSPVMIPETCAFHNIVFHNNVRSYNSGHKTFNLTSFQYFVDFLFPSAVANTTVALAANFDFTAFSSNDTLCLVKCFG